MSIEIAVLQASRTQPDLSPTVMVVGGFCVRHSAWKYSGVLMTHAPECRRRSPACGAASVIFAQSVLAGAGSTSSAAVCHRGVCRLLSPCGERAFSPPPFRGRLSSLRSPDASEPCSPPGHLASLA